MTRSERIAELICTILDEEPTVCAIVGKYLAKKALTQIPLGDVNPLLYDIAKNWDEGIISFTRVVLGIDKPQIYNALKRGEISPTKLLTISSGELQQIRGIGTLYAGIIISARSSWKMA